MYAAMQVDDYAVGVVGPGGRGTSELHGVVDRVDVLTGTLGTAMGRRRPRRVGDLRRQLLVSRCTARIRTQMSAAYSRSDLDRALDACCAARDALETDP